jgi:hypothetical protein
MDKHSSIIRWAIYLVHLVSILALLLLFGVNQVLASGGVGFSGTFSGQTFQLIPGESLNTSNIYVVVSNSSDSEIQIKLTPQTPLEVKIILESTDFTLLPGAQKKLDVGIVVGAEAVPGDYIIALTAEVQPIGGGIKLAGAVKQQANLSVLGEAGRLVLSTLSPDGKPFISMITLFRKTESGNSPIERSDTGVLETRLPPGDYYAEAYFQDTKVADESFGIAADDNKMLSLSVKTVLFEGFGIVPNYQNETGELVFARVVYTVRNLYQSVDKAEVILDVSRDSKSLEEVTLANLSPLDTGSAGLNYNYIPAGGWQNGNYSFKLRLNLDGKPYTDSLEQQLNVKSSTVSKGGINPIVIGSIAGGLLVVTISSFLLLRRLRRP